MMDADFNHFLDSVMIEAAGRQNGARVEPVLLKDLCMAVQADFPPTWLSMLEDRIRQLHYGDLLRDPERPGLFWFSLNGTGLAHVHEVKVQRRKPTLRERFRSIPWGAGAWEVAKLALAALFGAWVKTRIG